LNRDITTTTLQSYFTEQGSNLQSLKTRKVKMISQQNFIQSTFDMKSDLNDLKKLTLELIQTELKVQETNKI
jgi:hypothetical protein